MTDLYPHDFYAALSEALEAASMGHHRMVDEVLALQKRGGRLFCLGLGGGAANAAHAVNDFRKLCDVEAYAPTDGISELTARANDDGWPTVFEAWLRVSHLRIDDALLVFSVGGGTQDVSPGIYDAVSYAKEVGARVLGVVGRHEGATAELGDAVVVVEAPDAYRTPVTESVQIAVLHALVSDARLKRRPTKW